MITTGRGILALLLILAVLRADATVAGMRALFFASLFFLGAVTAIAAALCIVDSVVRGLQKNWRGPVFDACGVLDCEGVPCMLPADHRDTEHATAWVARDHDRSIEHRHRFDDVVTEGRTERRAARGALPKVTRTGNPTPAAK